MCFGEIAVKDGVGEYMCIDLSDMKPCQVFTVLIMYCVGGDNKVVKTKHIIQYNNQVFLLSLHNWG